MVLISSRANERVKQVRSLGNRRQREETGAFFAEGARLIEAALAHGATIDLAVVAPERLAANEQSLVASLDAAKVPLLEVTGAVADAVPVPVIASGGAGSARHVALALEVAQAALLASILHEDPARLVLDL